MNELASTQMEEKPAYCLRAREVGAPPKCRSIFTELHDLIPEDGTFHSHRYENHKSKSLAVDKFKYH
jgi:hypothetical protein